MPVMNCRVGSSREALLVGIEVERFEPWLGRIARRVAVARAGRQATQEPITPYPQRAPMADVDVMKVGGRLPCQKQCADCCWILRCGPLTDPCFNFCEEISQRQEETLHRLGIH